MTWSPPPSAGSWHAGADPGVSQAPSYPSQPYPPQPPPYPAQRPARPAMLRWAAAAVVFALLLVSAVVVHRTVLSQFIGGAASPEAAVTQLVAAIEAGDVRRLALLLPPDEIAGLSDVAQQLDRISSALGDETGFTDLTSSNGTQVSVANLRLRTRDEQHGLTKVSIENADITTSFDPDQLSGAVKEYVENEGLAARDVTVTVRGAAITVDGDTDIMQVGGREQAPFVMTVERDGSWYVSPLFTLFQYASEDEGYRTSPVSTTPGFGSPVEAAEGYLSGLAEAINTRDIIPFAEALTGAEGRLLQTYRSFVNSGFFDPGVVGIAVEVLDSQFSVLASAGNTARVSVDRLSVTGIVDGVLAESTWDGRCLTNEIDRHRDRYCLDDSETIGPFSPLVERLNFLVAVRADGGWKISTLRTVFTMAADMLSWIGDAELPILRALTRADATELTDAAPVAGTVRIDDSTIVGVEPIGPYIDGGYVVVDIPNPRGEEFGVYCESETRGGTGCDVVTVVTPSGDTQSTYRGGRNGEAGVYQAIVVAGAGDVEIFVLSR